MPSFTLGVVTDIVSERRGIQRVKVGDSRAYVLTEIIGPVSVGDSVVMNTTAVDLDLGTGGWNVVHWNLSRSDFSTSRGGHIMKLRYTSEQAEHQTLDESLGHSESLNGLPVVVCFLHSQFAVVAAAMKHRRPDLKIAYIQTDTAALPYVLSDTAAQLESSGIVNASYTIGQAFGAQYEAVTLHSALIHAHESGMDVVVVAPGPGVVGTGSAVGYSSVSVASELDAIADLGGTPICCVRYSSGDLRERHQGVSHHTKTALGRFTHCRPIAALPEGINVEIPGAKISHVAVGDIKAVMRDSGISVTVMGRDFDADPEFFNCSAAAAEYALQHLGVIAP